MRWRRSVIFSVSFAILGSACHLSRCGHEAASVCGSARFADWPDATSEWNKRSSDEIIHTGDTITIHFHDPDGANGSVLVDDVVKQDGTVTLLSNRIFTAAGKTMSELDRELRENYGPRFFPSWRTEPLPYTVDGEVKFPGRHVYMGPLTVSKAIQSAGGFTKSANQRKIRLVRSDRTNLINYSKALKDPALDMKVLPGDKILVPRSFWKW